MCGLTGLYHPEFKAMYEQLPRIGGLQRVTEKLHEASPDLKRYLKNERGVLTINGIHTIHRFYKIASLINTEEEIKIKHVTLSNNYFNNCRGEDTAQGELRLLSIPFQFDISYRDGTSCDNGFPIEYVTKIEGTKGMIIVIGWEKCESIINGRHKIHYQHSDGPLKGNSQYSRMRLGLENQIDEFLRFIHSGKQVHFTIKEALNTQKIIEKCYKKAHYKK